MRIQRQCDQSGSAFSGLRVWRSFDDRNHGHGARERADGDESGCPRGGLHGAADDGWDHLIADRYALRVCAYESMSGWRSEQCAVYRSTY